MKSIAICPRSPTAGLFPYIPSFQHLSPYMLHSVSTSDTNALILVLLMKQTNEAKHSVEARKEELSNESAFFSEVMMPNLPETA